MTITFLNQNSKTFLDIPGQFCDFPRTSQYEIQGYFQDKGSFLGLFLEKSWAILLLLSQNKFLFNLCYYSNNHILLCIFYYFIFFMIFNFHMTFKGGFSHIKGLKLFKTKSAFSRVVSCCLSKP